MHGSPLRRLDRAASVRSYMVDGQRSMLTNDPTVHGTAPVLSVVSAVSTTTGILSPPRLFCYRLQGEQIDSRQWAYVFLFPFPFL